MFSYLKSKNISIKKILLSLVAAFSLMVPLVNYRYMNLTIFAKSFNMLALAIIFLAVLFINRKDYSLKRSKKILSLLFGIFMIIGQCYVNGTILIFDSIINIILLIIKLVGYTYLFETMFYIIDKLLEKIDIKEIKPKNKYFKWYIDKLDKYPFRTSLITIMIFWLIYLVAFYPIILNPDSSFQIMQFFNVKTKYIEWVIPRSKNVNMTTHHPVLQTVMLGISILLGRSLGSDNLGLFIYTIVQTLFLASVLSLTIKFLDKNKVPNSIKFSLILIYSLVPMFPLYAMTAVKDTYYTGFIILFVMYIIDYINNYKDKKISIKNMFLLLVITLFIALFRNNGIYIVVITLFFMLFYSKTNIKRLGLTLVVFLCLITSYNKVLIPKLGISDGSIREALSIPFQQTARLAKYDDEIIDSKDKKTIDKVLNYKTLAKRYNPELADNVKNEYNKYTKSEDLKAYFKVWFKYLKKKPLVYIDATLNNTYGYIYPNTHNSYLYTMYDSRIVYGYDKYKEDYKKEKYNKLKEYIENDKYGNKDNINIKEPKKHHNKYITEYELKFDKPLVNYHFNKLEGLRNILTEYGNIFPYIPLLGLLCSIGFSTWMVLIISVYLKNKKYKLALIPLYLSILVCFASPANTYFRYALPVIFSLPFILCLIISKKGVYIENDKK